MKTSIVITAYLEASKPYLDLCMRSLSSADASVTIVTHDAYAESLRKDPHYESATVIRMQGREYSNAEAVNVGVEHALKAWPDVIIYANDDVVFTRDSVRRLAECVRANPKAIVMPLSNDQQGRYVWPLPVMGPYKIEQALEQEFTLKTWPCPDVEAFFAYDTLCTYVLAFTPNFWRAVGGMDQRFKRGGPDDIDLCMRARQAGFQPVIYTGAIVWHAGGVSADVTHDSSTREENHRLFNEKWGIDESSGV